jgi:hypothetical protein
MPGGVVEVDHPAIWTTSTHCSGGPSALSVTGWNAPSTRTGCRFARLKGCGPFNMLIAIAAAIIGAVTLLALRVISTVLDLQAITALSLWPYLIGGFGLSSSYFLDACFLLWLQRRCSGQS